ncbi:hypothetical protein NECAME_01488 [Necator americanus]|uniref:Uncharacterized protein n=1 Tax=Necator americanus TaxID=51031 RepID=W2TT26_NECAM|nr:hypothetical protein NECAME_01488 [Necator americanus]ETN84928.1 hypothetical protein NECAME_01488 [Necator americanus]
MYAPERDEKHDLSSEGQVLRMPLMQFKKKPKSSQYLPILGLNASIYTNISLVLFYCIVVPLNVFFFVSIVPELTRKCVMKIYVVWDLWILELLDQLRKLCLLLCPSLLAVTLLLIALFPTESKSGFEPRFPMSMSTTLPRVMLVIVILDVFWRVAFFFQLLEVDFEFRIVTGSELGDDILRNILDVSYEIAIFIVHLFPFYFAVLLMIFVRHYRTQTSSRFSQISAVLCCKSDTIVDYRCETMRSILADQKKRRSMMVSVH